MNGHVDGVLHIEKVPHLLAIFVLRLIALKEANFASFENLVVSLIDKASHIPFVPFIRSVDVEIL